MIFILATDAADLSLKDTFLKDNVKINLSNT